MEIVVPDQTFVDTLRRQTRAFPDRVALITPTKSWTYAELDAESNRVAQGLRALGIGAEDRVGCLTKHTAECALLAFAAMKIGAVCVPFNWRLAAPELDYAITHNEIRFLLTDDAFLPTLAKVNCAGVKLTLSTEGAASVPAFARWRSGYDMLDLGFESAPDDTALQLSSSGTTGLPKSVELTHR